MTIASPRIYVLQNRYHKTVFPVPFLVRAKILDPRSTKGIASSWIGDGFSNPISNIPISSSLLLNASEIRMAMKTMDVLEMKIFELNPPRRNYVGSFMTILFSGTACGCTAWDQKLIPRDITNCRIQIPLATRQQKHFPLMDFDLMES